MNYRYIATCLFGIEKILSREIEALGYKIVETTDGRVTFEGPIDAVARANIWLRTAEKVYILMDTFKVMSFEDLFTGVKKLPWEEWIGKNCKFPVTGHALRSQLHSVPDCQKIAKKAIVERLRSAYGIEGMLEETGSEYRVEFFIYKDMAQIMLDTSGTPLYKRGYRIESNTAPMRETLAAALIKLAAPFREVVMWDPFCGSGTLPVETALIRTNTAPGISRKFAAMDFSQVPDKIWKDAKEEAEAAIIRKPDELKNLGPILAGDINPRFIRIAKENAKRANVQNLITFRVQDALSAKAEQYSPNKCTVITNPPYGERIMTPEEADELYTNFGKVFTALPDLKMFVITPNENFEKLYGKKANKVRKLYNGMIKCNYYQYF